MASTPRPNPLLVGISSGVLLAAALFLFRFEPALRSLLAAKDQTRTLTASIASAPPVIDLTPLQDEVDAARAERDALAAANAERTARVAPDAEVPDLEHRVAALAREAGLRLESQGPAPQASMRAAAPAQPVVARGRAAAGQPEPQASAPRGRRWTFGGTFHGLWTFIAALDQLPRRVVLRDLRITVREPSTATPALVRRAFEPPLEIQVTVIP